MAYFFVYETKDFPLKIVKNGEGEGKVLEGYEKIIVSLKQGTTLIEKDETKLGIDVENDIINLHLSQEETGAFSTLEQVKLQVNIYYTDTERDTSQETYIDVYDNLHKEIMP